MYNAHFTTRQYSADEIYMHRCLQLARLAEGHVASNPLVGAVLVHQTRIIGEGYHQQFGKPHAEVNCIASVAQADKSLIGQSTLYVSLEPCAHQGKTPPCADLIIQNKIPRVVIGCRDPFVKVDGKGIERLLAAGTDVSVGALEKECLWINRRFMRFHQKNRPYIVLKWAETQDGKIAGTGNQRVLISNEYSSRWVHKWRAEESAILVGTHTALLDDPLLSVRYWTGKQPLRIVVDLNGRLPGSLRLFNGEQQTLIFTSREPEKRIMTLQYETIGNRSDLIPEMLLALHRLQVLSILVEGGAKTLQSFIDAGLWDECRIIQSGSRRLPGGLPAPVLLEKRLLKQEKAGDDQIDYFVNPEFF